MKNKLAIFDLDGTLFDTRAINFYAYQKALEEEGFSLERDFYESECNGKYYKDYLPLLIPNPSNELMERIHENKKQLYPAFLKHAAENTHLFHIISCIKNEYHIALVTTASKANCFDILSYFHKTDLFEHILTHNDVEKVKPDPEGFLKAMDFFKISAENTIIFEDSPSGILAAQKSGATVFAVSNFA